jgi:hypothetical protein
VNFFHGETNPGVGANKNEARALLCEVTGKVQRRARGSACCVEYPASAAVHCTEAAANAIASYDRPETFKV